MAGLAACTLKSALRSSARSLAPAGSQYQVTWRGSQIAPQNADIIVIASGATVSGNITRYQDLTLTYSGIEASG